MMQQCICNESAVVYLPEDKGAHEDAGHGGIRPGVSIQLMRGKLAVALNIHHLHGNSEFVKADTWFCDRFGQQHVLGLCVYLSFV